MMLTSVPKGTEKKGKKGYEMNAPAEIAANYVKVGKGKIELPTLNMFLLSLLAGMYIAFGAIGSQAAALLVQPAALGKFMGAWVFPTGLMLVLLAGAELFTGNCLLVIPVLQGEAGLTGMLRSWAIVFVGNLAGGMLIAAAATKSHVFSQCDGAFAETVVRVAGAKTSLSFSDAFFRGILCNILVCLAVWAAFAARELAGKILALYLPIMVFVLSGYEHSIANAYFIPAGIFAAGEYGIAAEGLGWYGFFVRNLLPVTLGNIVGGVLIGILYWAVYLRGKKS